MNTGLCLIIQIIDFVQESVRTPIFSADEFEDKILKEINSISTAINKLSSKGENNV